MRMRSHAPAACVSRSCVMRVANAHAHVSSAGPALRHLLHSSSTHHTTWIQHFLFYFTHRRILHLHLHLHLSPAFLHNIHHLLHIKYHKYHSLQKFGFQFLKQIQFQNSISYSNLSPSPIKKIPTHKYLEFLPGPKKLACNSKNLWISKKYNFFHTNARLRPSSSCLWGTRQTGTIKTMLRLNSSV